LEPDRPALSSGPAAGEAVFRALHEMAVAAGGERDPLAVARLAVERVRELLSADSSAIYGFDTVTGLLRPLQESPTASAEGPLVPGEGAVGLSFQSGEPVVITDYETWPQAVVSSRRRGVRSGLAVPLIFEQRAIGAMGIWSDRQRLFDDADVQLASLVAAQVAPALESARLGRESEFNAAMFQALHEVAVAAAGVLDIRELAQLGVDRARAMLGAGGVGMWWWEPGRQALQHLVDAFPPALRASGDHLSGEEVVRLAFDKRRSVIVDDYPRWPGTDAPQGRVSSVFAVPLMVGDRAVGAVAAWYHEPHRILPREVQLLALFASQVGPTIESAHLTEDTESKARTFEALHELAVAAGGVLDPAALGQLAADRVRDLLGADSAGLGWHDADYDLLRLIADNDPAAESPSALALDSAVAGEAFYSRQPVQSGEYESLPSANPRLVRSGVRSFAGVPLLVGDRALGVLVARSRQPGYFDPEKLKLMSLVASQVAPAMESARLVQERVDDARRFRLLHELAVAAGGVLETDALAGLAVAHARDVMEADHAALLLWSEADWRLSVVAEVGHSLHLGGPAHAGGVIGRAFGGALPVVVEDYPAWEGADRASIRDGIRSAAAVPLMAGDRPLGVLAVASLRSIRYSGDHLRLLTLLAAQVAPALESARLHADLVTSEERYRSLYQAIASGILVLDARGRVLDANRTAEEVFGYSLEEMLGRSSNELWEAFGEEGGSGHRPGMEALASGQPVLNRLLRITRRGGGDRWLQCDSVPMLGADGQPARVVTSFLDVTEMRRAEAALRESESRFRAVFDRAAVGIARVDLDGRLIEVNPTLASMFGWPAEDLLGTPAVALLGDQGYSAASLERLSGGVGEVSAEALSQTREGNPIWVRTVASLVQEAAGNNSFVIVMVEDVTEEKAQQDALEHQALHDALTGLPNRLLLHDRLQQSIRMTRRTEERMALLMMDLDRFKDVNDTFGHHVGDVMLAEVAQRLQAELRDSDTVARLGGDEFAIVLSGVEGEVGATATARKLLRVMETPFRADGGSLHVAASVGIALSPDHGDDPDVLMRHADVAMYVAKRSGGGCAVYAAEADTHSPGRMALVADLRTAIDGGQLELVFQPEIDIKTRRVSGMEALVRWRHPERGLLLPEEFVPLAEQTGLIRPLSLWVLTTALRQARAWQDLGLRLRMAVNLPMPSIHDPDLPETLAALFARHQVDPSRFQIEITESALMADPDHAEQILARLDSMGVGLSIDDFGTGYSSLSYLRRLPVREIKIDRSFVADMTTDANAAVIVRSTADLGHNLGLKVVAEGVEEPRQWAMAAAFGCDYAQGYLLGRPISARRMTASLQRSPVLPESIQRLLQKEVGKQPRRDS